MSFTLLSVLVLLLFFSFAFLEVYNGIKRGFRFSLISLGNVVLSIFLSLFVTSWISSALASSLMMFFGENEIYKEFAGMLPSLESIFPNILHMAIGAIIFLLVFLLVYLVMKMVVSWIYGKIMEEDEDDPGYGEDSPSCASRQSRAAGAACGLLSAILLTMTLLSPVMGVLEFADDTLNIVKQVSTDAYQAVGPGNAALVHEFTEDPLGNLFYRGGGRAIFNSATGTTVSGKRVYLLDEADTISKMSEDMFAVYIVFCDPEEASGEHAFAMRRLAVNMKKLTICEKLSAEVVKQCASAWSKDESFLLLAPPQMDGVMEPVFDEIVNVCSNTNFSNVYQNMETLLEVYALIVESGILKADFDNADEVIALMEKNGTLKKINQALARNPYMSHIKINSIAMSAFASYTEASLSEQQREKLTASLAQAIGDARSQAGGNPTVALNALSYELREVIETEGMEISSEFSKYIAEQLLSELPDKNISAEDVDRLFDRYLMYEN